MSLWEIFKEGGFVMWPLLIFSIASWCVIVEKFITLRRFQKITDGLFHGSIELLKNDKQKECRDLCLQTASPIACSPLLVYLDEEGSVDKKDDKAMRRMQDTQRGLKRYLWVLGTVGSSAPFVGLFGTVVGIIKSFDSIATAGKGGFSVVASGISEALIATAAGILVAVIAVIFYNFFQTQLNQMMAEYKNRLEDFRDYFA